MARLRLGVSPVLLLELQYHTHRLCHGYFPIPPHHGALCSPQRGELEVYSSLGHTLASVCPQYRGGSRVQGYAASQILLMCSEPPSLPATFGSHTCRPAPLTSILLFFLFKAACSTRTSSPPYDFCSAFAELL